MSKYPVEGYGEVKDLLDKIKLYSNLRLKAYEWGVHSKQGGTVRDEADNLLGQIEKDLNEIVFACMDGGWI